MLAECWVVGLVINLLFLVVLNTSWFEFQRDYLVDDAGTVGFRVVAEAHVGVFPGAVAVVVGEEG